MQFLTARMRMTMGLVWLSVSIVLAANFIGIIPDCAKTVRQGRVSLCEAIAVYSSALVSRRDQSRLDAVLHKLVERNPNILSAGVRRDDGRLMVEVVEHDEGWQPVDQDGLDKSQILVPLWSGNKK